ncbi:MAG: hypothetical protein ACI30K_04180 [Muribaculaceae bacterium]
MSEDWRDKLLQLKDSGAVADAPEAEQPDTAAPAPARSSSRLDIVVERKGRGGKVATIVCGFDGDDSEVASVAATLRRRLATGGSARGGEILIQGERSKQVLAILTEIGYKARII